MTHQGIQHTNADFSMSPVRNGGGFTAEVVSSRWLNEQLIRITLTGSEIKTTDFSVCTDRYVKLSFPHAQDTVRRSYTVRNVDSHAGTLDIDFVVHGDKGVAGPWAQQAQPGDQVFLGGVGGGYRPAAHAPWHLLIGDESALPAIAAALEEIPAGAVVHAFIEIADADQRIDLAHPNSITWVPRKVAGHRPAPYGKLLAQAVQEFDLPEDPGHVFLHGEANMVRELRRHLRAKGYPMTAMSISGYWRDGASDEMWRSQKKEWKQAVDLDEARLHGA